jgi:hypothetical protein
MYHRKAAELQAQRLKEHTPCKQDTYNGLSIQLNGLVGRISRSVLVCVMYVLMLRFGPTPCSSPGPIALTLIPSPLARPLWLRRRKRRRRRRKRV